MVDVEGKQKDTFLTQFDQHYPALEAKYQSSGMEYRPSNRKFAIAWKKYPITQDIDEIAQIFKDAFEEFQFLTPEIDTVLAEMNRK